MPTSRLTCVVRHVGDFICVEFVDPVVMDDGAINEMDKMARQALERSAGARLVIDFGNVTYVSSAVFGKLIALNRLMRTRGHRLIICGLTPTISEIFTVTRLNSLFDIRIDRPDISGALY